MTPEVAEDAFLDDGLHLSDAIGRQVIGLVKRELTVVGLAEENLGIAMDAKIPMITTTIRSSISVNPLSASLIIALGWEGVANTRFLRQLRRWVTTQFLANVVNQLLQDVGWTGGGCEDRHPALRCPAKSTPTSPIL